jgi:hypothetical protein
MTSEQLSAIVAVISLLGIIASNYYIYRARLRELEIQSENQRNADKVTLLREIQNNLIELDSEIQKLAVPKYGQSPDQSHKTTEDIVYTRHRTSLIIASIDDPIMQELALVEESQEISRRNKQAIMRLGNLINEEMQISTKKVWWQFWKRD